MSPGGPSHTASGLAPSACLLCAIAWPCLFSTWMAGPLRNKALGALAHPQLQRSRCCPSTSQKLAPAPSRNVRNSCYLIIIYGYIK